jgi:CBS-domain-containing membrane protein
MSDAKQDPEGGDTFNPLTPNNSQMRRRSTGRRNSLTGEHALPVLPVQMPATSQTSPSSSTITPEAMKVSGRRGSMTKLSNDATPKSVALQVAMGNRRGSLKMAKDARDAMAKAVAEQKAQKLANTNVRKTKLQAFLRAHRVEELKLNDAQVLNSDMTPADGFQFLLNNDFMSAPVFDLDAKRYTGFLNLRDLVSSIVYAHNQTHSKEDLYNEAIVHATKSQETGGPISLTYLSRRNPFRPCNVTDTLFEAAELLTLPTVHRVPVVDESGTCVSILSQSSLMKFLVEHVDELGDEVEQTAKEINVGFKEVITVPNKDSALTAFATLDEANISGLAVVDYNAKIVGATSAHDIQHFVKDSASLNPDVTILEYLAQSKKARPADKRPKAHCRDSSTVHELLQHFGLNRRHRVFMLDSLERPMGVVSITDILRFIVADQ